MVIPGLVSTVIAYPLLNWFYLRRRVGEHDMQKLDHVADMITVEEAPVREKEPVEV